MNTGECELSITVTGARSWMFGLASISVPGLPLRRLPYIELRWRGIDLLSKPSLQPPQERLQEQLVQQRSQWMIH
jgi:hypothetical protein